MSCKTDHVIAPLYKRCLFKRCCLGHDSTEKKGNVGDTMCIRSQKKEKKPKTKIPKPKATSVAKIFMKTQSIFIKMHIHKTHSDFSMSCWFCFFKI